MSTHNQRSESKERYWRTVMRRWRGSGLSVRSFCREQRISEPSFYAWRRTLAERDAVAQDTLAQEAARDARTRHIGAVGFVPMHVAPDSVPEKDSETMASDTAGALELIVSGGRRLRIGPGFDGPTLRRLLALLEEGRP